MKQSTIGPLEKVLIGTTLCGSATFTLEHYVLHNKLIQYSGEISFLLGALSWGVI